MLMGLNSISAQEVLNTLDLKTLSDIFRLFGEEKESFRIASNIIKQRNKKPITSIPELVSIIKKSKRKIVKGFRDLFPLLNQVRKKL